MLAVRGPGGGVLREGGAGEGQQQGAGRQQQRGEGGAGEGGGAGGGEEAVASQIVHHPGPAGDEAAVGGVQRARDGDDRHKSWQVRSRTRIRHHSLINLMLTAL